VLRPTGVTEKVRELSRSPSLVPLLCIAAAVVVANLPAIVHLVTTNPLVIDAILTPPAHGVLPGGPYIDPNAGYTTQTLGHLVALDWLHGHIPWWNPFEGAGTPLAGEMQSGAFFPPTLLLGLAGGLLAQQLLLEIVTGWATYFLLVRIGVGRTLSIGGGVAFGLCGTFAWLAHAPIRPVALLPICLVGVERVIDAAHEHRAGGWRLLAVALALSILAGFPETALINGILVAWWGFLRLAGPIRNRWRAVLSKLTGALIIGIALSLPLLVAFFAYLPTSDVGPHSVGFGHSAIPSVGLVQDVLPYSLGPIFGLHSARPSNGIFTLVWGNVGGFLSATVIAGALVGILGRRLRLLRLGLAAWVAFCLLRTYGDPTVLRVLASIPSTKSVAFFRYANPSWELAAVVLAALGLDDIARRRTRPVALVAGALVTGGLAAWAAVTAWPLLADAVATGGGYSGHLWWYGAGSLVAVLILLAVLLAAGLIAAGSVDRARGGHGRAAPRAARMRRRGRVVLAIVVVTESIGLFGFTALSAPPVTRLQTGSVKWLGVHLGSSRFFTLGPIQPEYGSYFGIGQVNVNDLPLPSSWNDYVASQLDPNAPRGLFTGGLSRDPNGPTPAEELTRHLAGYQAAGVRYVVEGSAGVDVTGRPFPAAGSPRWPAGPRLAYRDTFAEIWELPMPAPIFSAVAGNHYRLAATANTSPECSVVSSGTDAAVVDCTHGATVLRRVQYVPGWTASAGGVAVVVRPVADSPFQTVAVSSGRTKLQFAYRPPFATPAEILAALALAVLVGSWLVPALGARRRQ
jgi:hypothetical protein